MRDRLPPHAAEAEQGVLGCILLSPYDCISECIQKLRREYFYDLRHQELWEELLECYEDNLPIDLVTLCQRLKDKAVLTKVGGMAYLASLPDTVPSAANLGYYLEIVREKFVLRSLIQIATRTIKEAYESPEVPEDQLASLERQLRSLSIGDQEVKPMKQLVDEAICKIEAWHQGQGKLTGIGTGFPDLDRMTLGFQPGDFIVIAGRPSLGKTALAMQIAEHAAVEEGIPVGLFSLEMSGLALAVRSLCSRARVNVRDVRDGFLHERDFPKLTGAAAKLSKAPVYIADAPEQTVRQVRARGRVLVSQFGIKLFVIDYLQLLRSDRKAANRAEEVADISHGLKAMARELNVPVVALSQLSRDIEKENRTPRTSDLRESGAIEQDADLVGLLHCQRDKDGEEIRGEEVQPIVLNIAKQRNGPTGEINLQFLKEFTRFESAAKIAPEDVP